MAKKKIQMSQRLLKSAAPYISIKKIYLWMSAVRNMDKMFKTINNTPKKCFCHKGVGYDRKP